MGRSLLEQLEREGCRVNITIEREAAETRVANTAGAAGAYRSTAIGVSAELWRIAGDDVLAIGDTYEGADLPSDAALAALVLSVNRRLYHSLPVLAPPAAALPL